jgi:DNA-binding beta-propeller fold protein YncE
MTTRRFLPLLFCAALLLPAQASPKYKVAKTYQLGGEGGWDYLTWDAPKQRLFITRGTHVMVVDPTTGKVIGDIAGMKGIHGVALAPDLNKGFVSDGGANQVVVFDYTTLKTTGTIDVGDRPDAIAYAPATKRVFTFNGRGKDSTVIDATSNKVLGSIALGGKPEFAVANGKGRLFVNDEDSGELLELDPQAMSVKHRWKMAGCEEPTGLAIDVKHHRLFAGCGNRVMAIVDSESGKVVTTVPIGEGVDATAYDPEWKLAFSSNGRDGNLTVVREDPADKYKVLDTVETKRGARTMALDPKSHTVYVVTADFGTAPQPTAEDPHPRPSMVPGSFVLLVVEPNP